MFPVVSSSKNKQLSETFEAIVDNHALLFRDMAKYNLGGVEGRWGSMAEFSPLFSNSLVATDRDHKSLPL